MQIKNRRSGNVGEAVNRTLVDGAEYWVIRRNGRTTRWLVENCERIDDDAEPVADNVIPFEFLTSSQPMTRENLCRYELCQLLTRDGYIEGLSETPTRPFGITVDDIVSDWADRELLKWLDIGEGLYTVFVQSPDFFYYKLYQFHFVNPGLEARWASRSPPFDIRRVQMESVKRLRTGTN